MAKLTKKQRLLPPSHRQPVSEASNENKKRLLALFANLPAQALSSRFKKNQMLIGLPEETSALLKQLTAILEFHGVTQFSPKALIHQLLLDFGHQERPTILALGEEMYQAQTILTASYLDSLLDKARSNQ